MPKKASANAAVRKKPPTVAKAAVRAWIDTSVALPPAENAIVERLAHHLSGGIIIDAVERALLEYLQHAAGTGSTRGFSALKLELAVRRRSTAMSAFNLKTAPIELPMPHDDSSLDDDLLHLQTYLWVLVYAFDNRADRVKTQGQYFLSDRTYLGFIRALVRFPAPDAMRDRIDTSAKPMREERPARAVAGPQQRHLALRLPAHTFEAAQERMEIDGVRSFSELVRRALRQKAESVGLGESDGAPAFAHYPNPQLVEVQPNLEEPALALTHAMCTLAEKLQRRGATLRQEAAEEIDIALNTILLALRRA